MADIIDFGECCAAREGASVEGAWPIAGAEVPSEPAKPAAEALAALSGILDRAKRTGSIDAADHAAFAVYARAVLGNGWELRPRA
jgi:hypothetical protein